MNQYKHIVTKTDSTGTSLNEKDAILVGPFSVNNTYDSSKDFIDLHIYTLDGELLKSQLNYTGGTQELGSAGAGKLGASNLEIEPYKDAIVNGFNNGDVRLVYNFFTDLLKLRKVPPRYYVEEISADRLEVRLLTLEIPDNDLIERVRLVRNRLENQPYFSDFKLNFGKNIIATGININTLEYKNAQSVIVKLYKPLPASVSKKDICTVLETVSDSVSFDVQVQELEPEIKVPFLKGPNFEIELEKDTSNPTEFFNLDELFSYPVTSSYYQLYSLFNEKGAQISIDHTDYSNFIHFSSAEERLRNFKYKLDLIDSYQDSINTINSTGYTKLGSSGSKDYYSNLITGIVSNFDHYDRFLYYESGSNAWPKSNSSPPYTNIESDIPEATQWFERQLISASNFDITNYDVLTNSIPTYLREDSVNEPLIMFIHMLGQHFDNLWIYFKAVSSKYDADNRLNFGISKDLVREAIESFGVKVYNSNRNLENLFSAFTGEGYTSGSEVINTYRTITSGSGLEYLQPMPVDNYQKEIYKRIYHNLPLISKGKGTHRGLRALINCFGIPDDILTIKQFGGTGIDGYRHFSTQQAVTSSLDKIRLDNTGSLVSGSTLSQHVSIIDRVYKYSDDTHTVEVGFDISDTTNDLIQTRISSSFDYDDYIGDPRDNYVSNYKLLDDLADKLFTDEENGSIYNYSDETPFEVYRQTGDFIRLIKFFDNSIFRMVKDFIPARSNVNTGVVIKPHILNRSKIKQVQVSYENSIHTGSIEISPITASHAGAFDTTPLAPYTTNYSASYVTPLGTISRNITDESPKYTGEFSGSLLIASDGEITKRNPFKSQAQPTTQFSLRAFNFSLPIPLACDIDLRITKLGEFFKFTPVGFGSVATIYPETSTYSTTTISSSINYNNYQFVSARGKPNYPYYFEGWYDGENINSSNLIQTGSTLTIYENTNTDIDHYYGHFSTDPATRIVYSFSTRYNAYKDDGEAIVGTGGSDSVRLLYPEFTSASGAFNHTQNWDKFSSLTAKAIDKYNNFLFIGWYDSNDNLLTTDKSLTINEGAYGDERTFFAKFDNVYS